MYDKYINFNINNTCILENKTKCNIYIYYHGELRM